MLRQVASAPLDHVLFPLHCAPRHDDVAGPHASVRQLALHVGYGPRRRGPADRWLSTSRGVPGPQSSGLGGYLRGFERWLPEASGRTPSCPWSSGAAGPGLGERHRRSLGALRGCGPRLRRAVDHGRRSAGSSLWVHGRISAGILCPGHDPHHRRVRVRREVCVFFEGAAVLRCGDRDFFGRRATPGYGEDDGAEACKRSEKKIARRSRMAGPHSPAAAGRRASSMEVQRTFLCDRRRDGHRLFDHGLRPLIHFQRLGQIRVTVLSVHNTFHCGRRPLHLHVFVRPCRTRTYGK
mmetsp:Transcript_11336/g.28193  ORF Transcript_11336/g.28193 Transcript_11336/m.28193 type:complete len:294 (+) Transcript_11336:164-1045(+)